MLAKGVGCESVSFRKVIVESMGWSRPGTEGLTTMIGRGGAADGRPQIWWIGSAGAKWLEMALEYGRGPVRNARG